MNCLKHLLELLTQGYQFKIYYNGNHCIGVNSYAIHDYDNLFKKEIISGNMIPYAPIESYHNKELLASLFGVTENNLLDALDRYYNGEYKF